MAACWFPKTATTRSTASAIRASEISRRGSDVERGRGPDTAAVFARVASEASRQTGVCHVPFLGAVLYPVRRQQPAADCNLPGMPQGKRSAYRVTAADPAGALQSPEAPLSRQR